jgi:hypothetical protein
MKIYNLNGCPVMKIKTGQNRAKPGGSWFRMVPGFRHGIGYIDSYLYPKPGKPGSRELGLSQGDFQNRANGGAK